MNGIKVNLNLLHFRHKLGVFDASHVEQSLTGDGAVLVPVFVREVDHRLDARLNDHLGTLVTGEESHIDAAVGDFLRVLVQDGVHLRVTDVHVLVVQFIITLFPPGQFVI